MRTVNEVPARRRSVFAIIGMIVVGIVVLVIAYFAWVGWNNRGRPVPDVDVKTEGEASLPAAPRGFLLGASPAAPRPDSERG